MLDPLAFSAIFHASPNPYMVLNREFVFVAANDAYLRATGRQREEILGRPLFEAFPGNPVDSNDPNVALLRASLERVLTRRLPDALPLIPYTISHHTDTGIIHEERWWSATHTPIFDAQGEVALILQHTVDVTALQARHSALPQPAPTVPIPQIAEGLLQRSRVAQETTQVLDAERRHLLHLFDQAPGFIAFLRGPQHRFELANRAYFQLVGHREVVGKPVAEALPEVVEQGFITLLDKVYATGTPFVGREVRLLLQQAPHAELTEVYVDFVYQPIFQPDGSISGIFVEGHDVTRQKQARDELERYQQHLESVIRERTEALAVSQAALHHAQKMEAVGNLTGGVAHDFNNLLQVIGGNLHLLQRDTASHPEAARRVQSALGAVERGAKLARQLLAFARRQPLDPRVIHLGQLIQQMEELLRRTLGEPIAIQTVIPNGLWNTLADPNQLENVILNLAINARDAMNGAGTLTIEAANVMLEAEQILPQDEIIAGPYVLLAISDTGRGMSAEVQVRAFEPFFTTKPEGQGTGLGLSMAYGFVKQSGGHITLSSEVGQGTTIRVYLPRVLEPAVPLPHRSEEPVEGGNESILVVEDDSQVRATVVEMLTDLGYHVRQAADGQSALALVQSGIPFDLLFTDVVMPGPLASPELARQAQQHLPQLAVLFTSGYTESAIVHEGRLDAGVTLLSKPYGRTELARKIRQVLRSRPALAAESELRASQAVETEPTMPQRRILVVEDDMALRNLAQEILTDLGYGVVAVATAEQALTACAQQPFDGLFTDLTLPGMSGLALARRVRLDFPHMHIICTSGYQHLPPSDEAPPNIHFLPKPYSLEQIEAALDAFPAPLLPDDLPAGVA